MHGWLGLLGPFATAYHGCLQREKERDFKNCIIVSPARCNMCCDLAVHIMFGYITQCVPQRAERSHQDLLPGPSSPLCLSSRMRTKYTARRSTPAIMKAPPHATGEEPGRLKRGRKDAVTSQPNMQHTAEMEVDLLDDSSDEEAAPALPPTAPSKGLQPPTAPPTTTAPAPGTIAERLAARLNAAGKGTQAMATGRGRSRSPGSFSDDDVPLSQRPMKRSAPPMGIVHYPGSDSEEDVPLHARSLASKARYKGAHGSRKEGAGAARTSNPFASSRPSQQPPRSVQDAMQRLAEARQRLAEFNRAGARAGAQAGGVDSIGRAQAHGGKAAAPHDGSRSPCTGLGGPTTHKTASLLQLATSGSQSDSPGGNGSPTLPTQALAADLATAPGGSGSTPDGAAPSRVPSPTAAAPEAAAAVPGNARAAAAAAAAVTGDPVGTSGAASGPASGPSGQQLLSGGYLCC